MIKWYVTIGGNIFLNYWKDKNLVSEFVGSRKIKKPKIFRYKSRSMEDVRYEVRRFSKRKIICNCPGFTYNKNCWHIERVRNIVS